MSFDPTDRSAVEKFWEEIGGPVAASEEGFQGGLILESAETDGLIRAVTIWRDRSNFDSFAASPRHDPVTNGIRSTSMRTQERDGLNVMQIVEPVAAEIRVIRCSVAEGAVDGLRNFWRSEGRALVESAPGCVKVEALIDEPAMEVMISFHWRTTQAADAFRSSDEHNEKFVPGIEQFVTPVAKLHTTTL